MTSKDIAHFTSIPWTRTLLTQPNLTTFTLASRLSIPQDEPPDSITRRSQDELVRRILNTPETIPHILGFYTTPSSSSSTSTPNFPIDSCTILFDLREGLKGYNGITHGGFLATLLDEGMGNLMVINRSYLSSLPPAKRKEVDVLNWEKNAMLTAGINLRYLSPIVLPNTVAVVTKVKGIEGRKVVFDVEIRTEGEVCVKAEGVWIAVPKSKVEGRMKL